MPTVRAALFFCGSARPRSARSNPSPRPRPSAGPWPRPQPWPPNPKPNPHQAEKYLIDSGRPYTICHPGGLLNSNPNPNRNPNPNPNPNPYQAAYSTSLVASGSWSTPDN
eukprot:scaffold122806_cov36-Phaeocystis_antarctica.AAC.1